MKKNFLLLLCSFIVLVTLVSCTKPVNYDEVQDYSDSIVNSLLLSMNNLDYDTFSTFLCDNMKEFYTLSTFQKESANIINSAGMFESAEFYAGEDRNGYISLIYDVKFSNKEETTPISITFKKDDSEHKVQQLYFDSDLSNN